MKMKAKMKHTTIKALSLIAALTLLTSCAPAENPVLPNDPAVSDTTPAESETPAAATPESFTTKKETELMTVTEQSETAPESAFSESTSEALSATAPSELPGTVPDTYREDGESGIKIIGRNGHYMGLMGCWGTLENCDRYAEAVNRAAENLPEVKVYSMVIPTSSEFYTPEDVTGFTASQLARIERVSDGLSGSAGTFGGADDVNVYSTLETHAGEPVYTRTDHHWQPLGAYYAAEVFADKSGTRSLFPPLSDYKKVEKEGYMGSLYGWSKSENLYSDPETFTMYISPNDESLKTVYYDTSFQNGYDSDLFVSRDAGAYYCSFLGSDNRIAEITTDCDNGRCLVMFKESYGNALVPFLTSCFEKIYVCDVRYFDLDAYEFCREAGATDLLFAVCTFTPAGPNCSYVTELF